MVTGDSQAAARTVAAELGIERYHARVLPGEKARLVAELRASLAVRSAKREGGVARVHVDPRDIE